MTDLELAKSRIDLVDIIPGNKTRKAKYIFANPCPICGHNDHFVIVGNHYHSFNNCCERGTAIDWIMLTEGLQFKDAANKVLEIANVERKMLTREQKVEKQKAAQKEKEIERLFYMLYDNLVFIYKTLKQLSDLNDFGIWLFNFADNFSERFIIAEDKEVMINEFREELKTHLNYYLYSQMLILKRYN